jgi:two-component system chemotaxis response regulator CheB
MHRRKDILVRVLIADDSDIVALRLEMLLHEDARIRVVGRAKDGQDLMRLVKRCTADVVLLDALMPEMTGLSALRHVTPRFGVILVSSEPADSAVAREALAQGAYAFITKSDLGDSEGGQKLRDAVFRAARRDDPTVPQPTVLIAGSTGAIGPLIDLLRDIRDIPVPVLIVQHFPEGKEDALAHTLSLSGTPARTAEAGNLGPGIQVARIGHHLQLDRGRRLQIVDSPPVNGHRPSAEVLFRSAQTSAENVIAVMLSGLGSDGAAAMGELAERGAPCFALAPEDARAPSMPQAALDASSKVRRVAAAHLGRTIRKALEGAR